MANDRIYSRRKKEEKEEKEEKSNQTDPFPVTSQQPRSRADGCPKRRTDFSLFFSHLSPSPSHPDPESSGSKDGSCILSATSQDDSPGKGKIYPGIHLVPCHQFEYTEEGEAKSTRTVYKLQSETEREEEVHPSNSIGARQEDICEISIDHRFTSAGSEDSCERMTSNECVSGNAAPSISRSEDGSPSSANARSFEQPIEHHTQPSCSTKVFATAGDSVRSGQEGVDGEESGRGKRRRKAKVHFDDLKQPWESATKVRRLKIMRHLGLAAPAGSPFAHQ